MQVVEAERLEQHTRLGALERQQIELRREQVTLQGELNDLPLKTQAELATIDRNMATTEQELAEAEARREIVVPAPQDGTVTAILIEQGGHANVSAPLLSIVPAGASLEAHLYSPSRAVGFLRPGQHVLLRYQAYPYQKFGHYEGVLASVSRSAVNPGELPPQLAGVTTAEVAGAEPVYLITVRLARQTVTAYGRQVDLQPGMQLEADIALETRRLYEWVLDRSTRSPGSGTDERARQTRARLERSAANAAANRSGRVRAGLPRDDRRLLRLWLRPPGAAPTPGGFPQRGEPQGIGGDGGPHRVRLKTRPPRAR
jgi:membrane fusion protein